MQRITPVLVFLVLSAGLGLALAISPPQPLNEKPVGWYPGDAGSPLYPYDNDIRSTVRKLDGVWNFKRDANNTGMAEGWYNLSGGLPQPTILMPVPASFNGKPCAAVSLVRPSFSPAVK